jgi:hypothetical protein
MSDDTELDAWLCAPLAPVEDAGFSAALTAGIARRRRLRRILAWGPLALSLPFLAWLLPLGQVLLTPGLAAAAAVLLLTFLLEPVLAPR